MFHVQLWLITLTRKGQFSQTRPWIDRLSLSRSQHCELLSLELSLTWQIAWFSLCLVHLWALVGLKHLESDFFYCWFAQQFVDQESHAWGQLGLELVLSAFLGSDLLILNSYLLQLLKQLLKLLKQLIAALQFLFAWNLSTLELHEI